MRKIVQNLGWKIVQSLAILSLVQVQFGLKYYAPQVRPDPGFKLMASTSWRYILCHWDACSSSTTWTEVLRTPSSTQLGFELFFLLIKSYLLFLTLPSTILQHLRTLQANNTAKYFSMATFLFACLVNHCIDPFLHLPIDHFRVTHWPRLHSLIDYSYTHVLTTFTLIDHINMHSHIDHSYYYTHSLTTCTHSLTIFNSCIDHFYTHWPLMHSLIDHPYCYTHSLTTYTPSMTIFTLTLWPLLHSLVDHVYIHSLATRDT